MAYCISSELPTQSLGFFLSSKSANAHPRIYQFNGVVIKDVNRMMMRGHKVLPLVRKMKGSQVWSAFAAEEVAASGHETALVELLLGVQGRGRGISAQQREEIAEAVKALESEEGVISPAKSPLIEGLWQLLFTTRPGTASPIQAAASVESGQRILFRFDRAAFAFKFLPFKVPYPVPFRLLGDEAKGWLDTTYLSPSGNFRISRGNKGTIFVLQKDLDPRQHLFQAISSNMDIQKAIDELLPLNPTEAPSSLETLAGKWRLVWSSQAEDANWLQKLTSGLPSWQVVASDTGKLENLVEIFPGLRLKAKAISEESSKIRRDVTIKGAELELGSLSIPVNITGTGYVDLLYLDSKIRISRGNKGSLFVHIRET
ncbi:hypothetical protein O6H91_02G068500 [Diphasiastrum complanatum]|uniref:Uncharacterized protein n=1 Tax=Diphasiastrum complanatum TaxID=34168 RepID=A0ACC2EGX5_DIPCM|nr:hypothetical protein O6H91_02G068500 [Diphasiastrum complanatum]